MILYGLNLLSGDPPLSARIYSEVFGFKIEIIQQKHAEVLTTSGLKLLFSPDDGHCKINPGSFTLSGVPSDKFLKSDFFTLEQSFPEKKYTSYLDLYGNRIWIYSL